MKLSVWTYEGPPHVGAMRVVTAMKNTHYVLHAPQGDTYADLLFTMIERKNTRIENNQGSNIDELEKEMRRVEKIREDAEAYIKSSNKTQPDLRVKVNLDPEFENIKTKASIE